MIKGQTGVRRSQVFFITPLIIIRLPVRKDGLFLTNFLNVKMEQDKRFEGIEIDQILSQFVKTKSGKIYQVMQRDERSRAVYLCTKNIKVKKDILEIKQGLAIGRYSAINEHEFRRWAKEDREFMDDLNHKMVKRTILSQLLLELDDELIVSGENLPYMRNLLLKSNKEIDRIISKNYDKMYGQDQTLLTNLMNRIDKMTTVLSKMKVSDLIQVGEIIEDYVSDPEKYKKESFEFDKVL